MTLIWLVIHIAPHPLFDIVNPGSGVVLSALAPWEAALGAKVSVPTLKERILLTIPRRSGWSAAAYQGKD